jgi:ABC-type antimicrobial peptide transport system permease subunit
MKLLPWEYGVRNLLRRPARSGLTLAGLTLVVLLIFVVVGFVRGLEVSLAVSGDPNVVLVHTLGSMENIEYSSVPTSTPELLASSIGGIQRRYGAAYASGELYAGVAMRRGKEDADSKGLVRGVTAAACLVRRQVEIVEGAWPGPGEILVGKLAATKLSWNADDLAVGKTVEFEGRTWRVSGRFTARGAVFESEIWCRLDDLQQAMKRQDLSLVAVALAPGGAAADIDLFCKQRIDLELQATRELAYYEALHKHYRPVRLLAWTVVLLVAAAGVFAGLNTMYGAVIGRVRELATLQTIGFVRRAIALSIVQEAGLLAALAAVIAAVLALLTINGAAMRFTMGAFVLQVDSTVLLMGCGAGLMLGVIGALPPAVRAMRLSVAEALKAI